MIWAWIVGAVVVLGVLGLILRSRVGSLYEPGESNVERERGLVDAPPDASPATTTAQPGAVESDAAGELELRERDPAP